MFHLSLLQTIVSFTLFLFCEIFVFRCSNKWFCGDIQLHTWWWWLRIRFQTRSCWWSWRHVERVFDMLKTCCSLSCYMTRFFEVNRTESGWRQYWWVRQI